jgi:hypothetical protein
MIGRSIARLEANIRIQLTGPETVRVRFSFFCFVLHMCCTDSDKNYDNNKSKTVNFDCSIYLNKYDYI